MSDLLFQNISTVQSDAQPTPKRMAAAATITPTTFLTFLSGTTQVANITPPTSGSCLIGLIFTDANPGAFLDSGNIESTRDPAQNVLVLLAYDPVSAMWYADA